MEDDMSVIGSHTAAEVRARVPDGFVRVDLRNMPAMQAPSTFGAIGGGYMPNSPAPQGYWMAQLERGANLLHAARNEIAALRAELAQIKAEKASWTDAIAGLSQRCENSNSSRISRAIGNYDNSSAKMGLPLHDRY